MKDMMKDMANAAVSQAQSAAEAALRDPSWRTAPEFAALRMRIDTLFREEPVALN